MQDDYLTERVCRIKRRDFMKWNSNVQRNVQRNEVVFLGAGREESNSLFIILFFQDKSTGQS